MITGWNNQAEKMFGWTRVEALGRELAELVIPERDREAHRHGMRRYIETGMARVLNKRIEMAALHREGHEFPGGARHHADRLRRGAGVHAPSSATSPGARAPKRRLRESELRFRTTANAAPVLIWMSGPDKRCTWFNQRWLDFVGRAIEQELGDGWCDNLHPADFDRALDTYHAAFDARRPYEMEYRLQRDDGAWRWLLERGTPNFGPGGEFEGYIGTCIDITEHRETVEQLRESRARFKTLAESLPQMIWTCTRDGYTDYLSRQWLDYTGRSEAQQLGKGWLEQVHPDDRVKVEMEWSRVVGSGDAFDMSFRIRRFDGVYRWFKTRAVPLRDPAGRILKWFGSNTDIEDFVIAEQQAQGAARAHATARSHHARHRRSPGAAQGVRSGAAQPRGQPRHRFRLHLRSTQTAPAQITISYVGDEQRAARQGHRHHRERADRRGRRGACTLRARRARLRGATSNTRPARRSGATLPPAACARWWRPRS